MLECTWFILSLVTLTLHSYGGSWCGVLFVKPKELNIRRRKQIGSVEAMRCRAKRGAENFFEVFDFRLQNHAFLIIFLVSFCQSFPTTIFSFRWKTVRLQLRRRPRIRVETSIAQLLSPAVAVNSHLTKCISLVPGTARLRGDDRGSVNWAISINLLQVMNINITG